MYTHNSELARALLGRRAFVRLVIVYACTRQDLWRIVFLCRVSFLFEFFVAFYHSIDII